VAEDKIVIGVEVKGDAERKLKKVGKAGKKAASTIEVSFKKAGAAFDVFVGNLAANAVGKSFQLAGSAVRAFTGFLGDSIEAAKVQEDAVNKLNIALKSSGKFTEAASQDLQDYASALQQTTKFGDETILETQALLQSLGQLDKEGLKRATTASLDLASALGIDLNAATLLVGKAAAGEVGSFSRYGLIIKKASTNAETFTRALQAIEKQFGGAAQAQVKTFSGATAQLANTFGDLQEEIGFVITENKGFAKAIAALNEVAFKTAGFIKANREELTRFALQILDTAVSVIPKFIGGLKFVNDAAIQFKSSNLTMAKALANVQFILGNITSRELVQFERGLKIDEEQLGLTAIASDEFFQTLSDNADKLRTRIREAGEGQLTDKAELNEATNDQSQEQNEVSFGIAQDLTAKEQVEADKVVTAELTRRQKLIKDLKQINTKASKARIKDEQVAIAAIETGARLSADTRVTIEAERSRKEQQIRQQDLQSTAAIFGNLASLQQTNSKTLFAIGKASATAQAIVQGILAVQKALTAGPFLGPILAASTAIATAVNVSKIQSTSLQAGIDSVPGVGTRDNFPALLAPGERVVPRETNIDLKEFLANNQESQSILREISAKLGALQQQVTVNIGNSTIVDELRDAFDDGRVIEV